MPDWCSISPFCYKNISLQKVPAVQLHFTGKSFYPECVAKGTGFIGSSSARKRGAMECSSKKQTCMTRRLIMHETTVKILYFVL